MSGNVSGVDGNEGFHELLREKHASQVLFLITVIVEWAPNPDSKY